MILATTEFEFSHRKFYFRPSDDKIILAIAGFYMYGKKSLYLTSVMAKFFYRLLNSILDMADMFHFSDR